MENNFFLFLFPTGISLLALILGIITLVKIKKIEKKQEKMFSGKKVKNLENLIMELVEKTDNLDKDIENLFSASNQINKLSLKGISKIGMVRFNPFGEKGHKSCFALALLNGKKKGMVCSTLSTESGTKIFIKKVANGKSDIQLTEEEKNALRMAK
jgi:hypothetical protein